MAIPIVNRSPKSLGHWHDKCQPSSNIPQNKRLWSKTMNLGAVRHHSYWSLDFYQLDATVLRCRHGCACVSQLCSCIQLSSPPHTVVVLVFRPCRVSTKTRVGCYKRVSSHRLISLFWRCPGSSGKSRAFFHFIGDKGRRRGKRILRGAEWGSSFLSLYIKKLAIFTQL